jgi:hypothetical protein
MKDVFFFDSMLTPKIITFVYWFMLLGSLVSGVTVGIGIIFTPYGGGILSSLGIFGVFTGLAIIVCGAVSSRILCELLVVLFKINENLQNIANKTTTKVNNTVQKTKVIKDTTEDSLTKERYLQEKLNIAKLEKEKKVAEKNKIIANQDNIETIISSGDIELLKSIITSKEDVSKCLSDNDFTNIVLDCDDVVEVGNRAIDFYIKHAKINDQLDIVSYLNNLK